MHINGVAHIFITAGDFEASRAFYRQLLPFMGLTCVNDSDTVYYCVGGRTGFGIEAPPKGREGGRFDQAHVGLHHVCWARAQPRGCRRGARLPGQDRRPYRPRAAGR